MLLIYELHVYNSYVYYSTLAQRKCKINKNRLHFRSLKFYLQHILYG